MKQKCSFILKASIALVLSLLMLLGSIGSVIAATVDMADLGASADDLAETGFNINGKIYFKKPSGWTNARLSIGGNNDNKWREMIAPSGNIDDIYYFNVNWTNADGFFFTDVSWNCSAEQGAYWDWYGQNATNRTGYGNSMTAGTLYTSTGNTDSSGIGSEAYSNITVSAKAYVKSGSTYTEASSSIATATVTGKDKDNNTSSTSIAKYTKSTFSTTRVNSSYTFLGWYTSSNVAIDGATNSTYEISSTESTQNLRAVYQLTETTYAVTVAAGSNGTVASSTVNAGATTPVTLPTATPNYGYKFKNWTKTGNVTITNATSASAATVTATGTGGTVTANFEKDDSMNLYIAGRFHIYNGTSWVNSFDSGDWSNTGDDNIKFTWDSTAQKYKVDTGASPAELTSQISNINPYFFVYDKTNSKNWYATSSTTLTNSTTSVTLSKSSGANNNLRFNSTSTDKPVTIWFDPTTGVLSYTIPTFYDVTVSSATGGSVTAEPVRAAEGTTVNLTATPSTGYQLSSITAKRTGTSTAVTLSGSGNTRTFSMPAAGVTVTPSFSKVNYNLTKANASNGSFDLQNSSNQTITTAQYQDTVKIVPTPATGYEIDTVKYNDGSDHIVEASSGTYSFEMPANAVTVTVTFKAINYTISVVTNGSGDVAVKKGSANVTTYNIGDSLSVTATPGTYSHLTSIEVSGAMTGTYATSPQTLDMSGKTGALTIRVTFEETTYTNLTAVGKYSENGSTYPNNMSTNPTISATSGSYDTGVTVTAPDVDGYQFVNWYTTQGSFSNQADKSTIFKPNANGAQAVAQYKKIFTITIGENETGEGSGTVTSSVASVAAGGEYTITLTPDSYSLVDTLKINGSSVNLTSGSGNTKTYNGIATADVTAVGKFTTNVCLGNRYFDSGNTNTWNTPKMKSNGDGTYSYTFTNVPSGRNGQFKAKVGDTYKDYSSDTTFDNGATGCTLSSINDGGVNYQLTTTEAINVTIVYTASENKITSVTVDPVSSVTYAITVGSPEDATLTATYRNRTYAEGETIAAREGQEISFSATAAEGKYVSGYTLGGTAVTSPYTVTSSDDGKTLTCTTANKATIVAKTNKSDRGTVSVSPSSAAPGDTITIHYEEKAGVLNTITATVNKSGASSETVTLYPAASGNSSQNQSSSTGLKKIFDLVATGASDDISYTVPANATSLQINATFDAYSGVSDYYYTGYDTSGNVLSAYDTKQMTEGMISGEKFSYYEVTGRTSNDQLFKVSKATEYSGGRYVYFSNNYNWNNLHVYFFDGVSWTWPGDTMTHAWDNVYKYQIPVGAKKVIFNNGENGVQTQDIDLTSTNGCYYLTGNGESPVAAEWTDNIQSDAGLVNSTVYSWGDSVYATGSDSAAPYSFGTAGFNDHGQDYAKPKGSGYTDGSYYIVVLYPNTEYTINGVTKTTGNKIDVIWMTELPGGDETVTVYAKDGAIRSESSGTTYANIADTKIYTDSAHTTAVGTNHSGSISGQTYETYKAEKGQTIYIRTIINDTAGNGADTTANNLKYFVRGFCVNGEVPRGTLNSGTADGIAVTGGTAYDLTYTVAEDYEGEYIEITPIYYLANTTQNPIVTFRVLDFPKDKNNWGDTLYCYPFYGKLGSNNNAFGAYPGQPIVYYNGQYSIQIPQKSTAWDPYLGDNALSGESSDAAKKTKVADTFVSGITMSNGYYDSVHRTVMGYGGNSASADHVQTYDYGDFYKIFKEKSPVDNIVYDFKYRETKHNFTDQITGSTTASALQAKYGTGGNGFELLKNFHGKNVDLFGTALSGAAATPDASTNPPVYVVSIGGVDGNGGVENVAGYYATEWIVYAPSANGSTYTRISANNKSSIPPEVLVLNDDDSTSFNISTYPSAVDGKNITDWEALYTALEAYRGKPVYISYEKANPQVGSGNYATSGGGGATRNDGRWLYSKTGESITSNIKIQYSSDNGANYTDLDVSNPAVSGLSAYFTNTEVEEGAMTFSTTIDPDKTFDFEAKTTNASYMFVGWYMDDSNKTLITTENDGSTERSGSYTFIARFKLVTSGQLVLQHTSDTDGTYKGSGESLISAVVKNGENETVQTYTDSSTITIPSKFIRSTNTDYKIEVTLKSTPTGYDTYGTTTLVKPDANVTDEKFFNNPTTTTSDGTTIKTFSFTVGQLYSGSNQLVNSLLYHSYFNKSEFTYNFTFTYGGRLSSGQSVTRTGTLSPSAVDKYVTYANNTYTLSADYIRTLAPYESNFNETLIWNITAATSNNAAPNVGFSKGYAAEVATPGENIRSTNRTATFALPYAHDDSGNPESTTPTIGENINPANLIISSTYGELIKSGSNYITAPETVYDETADQNKGFLYWEIYELDNNEKGQFVTHCFNAKFNYLAYDNYYIVPVYEGGGDPTHSATGASTSISYLDTTRNQWNNGGHGSYTISGQDQRNAGSDILFNDFALSFNYNEERLDNNEQIDGQDVEVGFIVEKVQVMDKYNQDGTYDTDVRKYIPTDEQDISDAKTAAEAAIRAINVDAGGYKAGTGDQKKYTKYNIDRTTLDNKNRIEFYYALYNAYNPENGTGDYLNITTNKKYVYRAYSYIKVGTELTVTDNPVYFIMYDEATKK